MTNEYVARRISPNGNVELIIINDSPIDVSVRLFDEKMGYTYEILEKLY